MSKKRVPDSENLCPEDLLSRSVLTLLENNDYDNIVQNIIVAKHEGVNLQILIDILLNDLKKYQITAEKFYFIISILLLCDHTLVKGITQRINIDILLNEGIAIYIDNIDKICSVNNYAFNKKVFNASLHGLGVLNYKTLEISGEATFLRRFLQCRKQALIFDIGANIGNYSVEIKKIAPDAVVYSFEPNSMTFPRLKNK